MNERKKLGIYIVQHDSQRSWKTFLIQVEVVVQELLSPPLVVKRLSHLLDQISLTNLAKKDLHICTSFKKWHYSCYIVTLESHYLHHF